jgi:hypothetical protein
MLARMPAPLFTEWMLYAQLELFGEERADLRAGIVAATVANVHRGKDDKALTPQDFMPRFEEQPEPKAPDWERMLHMVEMWNAALGGSDLRQ